MPAAKTIHFVSLGCAKNRVDTEVMLGVSGIAGFEHVDDPASAHVIVINTCGFIGPAKEESIETVLEMSQFKEAGSCEKLVVAGCLSQRYPEQLAAEMPEVDHFLGSSDMLKLERVLNHKAERMLVGNPAEYTMRAADPRVLTQSRHSAFLKIAEGCNRQCSFCAIPSFRGKQRSRSVADCVEEARRLVAEGVVEVNLISQDTIAYGRDLEERSNLAELLQALSGVEGLKWVRAHYLYPENLTADLIELFATEDKVLPYIDMPLQHASDAMLRRMKRGHGGERLYRLVDRLRTRIPELVFRTTFIVGHPGETDDDFAELRKFVEWAEFDHVGVFLYSSEEGTASHTMTDAIDERVAEERRRELVSLQRPISRQKLQSRVQSELTVLVDGVSDESEHLLQGRWWGQAPEVDGSVYLANGAAKPGEFRQAWVTDAADYDLVADLLDVDGNVDAPPGSQGRRPKLKLPIATLLCMLTLAGCASALPTFSGGAKTPNHRTDLGFGGAARVPVGKLRDSVVTNPYRERVEAGGVVPAAYVRRGLNERFDLGIMVAGTDVRLDFRGEKVLSPEPTIRTALIYALAPFGGWIVEDDNSGSGGRAGLEIPVVYGVDFGGVYELWLGARVTNEYIWGNFPLGGQRPRATAIGLRAGGVLGMALGLRRIHALIELTAAWEQWWGEHSTTSLNHGGVVLIPAFALRIRI